jgi:hypothetical protein
MWRLLLGLFCESLPKIFFSTEIYIDKILDLLKIGTFFISFLILILLSSDPLDQNIFM